MTRQLIVSIGFLAAAAAHADIYRWVDAEGRTHFSDRRPPENAVRLTMPETHPGTVSTGASEDSPYSAPGLGPYATFAIVVPAAGAVLEQATPVLAISLQLDPPLLEGHRLELLLDGRPVAVDAGSAQAHTPDIDFGAHRLQARVIDRLNAVLAATPVHAFELRQSLPPGVIP